MRYTLFGQGEGVKSTPVDGSWASVLAGRVTDASISARRKGIRPDMSVSEAEALLPGLVCLQEKDEPTSVMQDVWRILWGFSPWIETLGKDSFFLQIAPDASLLSEVRQILMKLDSVFTLEQRMRIGLAENPFLARALVDWSRLERVPCAVYRKVRNQQLIISPSLELQPLDSQALDSQALDLLHPGCKSFVRDARDKTSLILEEGHEWILQMPIQAVWIWEEPLKERLLELGIHRLRDLESIPDTYLYRHFGRMFAWQGILTQKPGGKLCVNYPPKRWAWSWQSNLGNGAPLEESTGLMTDLAKQAAETLYRTGFGAFKVGFIWETDEGHGQFERVSQRPLYRLESILANLSPAIEQMGRSVESTKETAKVQRIERMEVYVEDLHLLPSVQSTLDLKVVEAQSQPLGLAPPASTLSAQGLFGISEGGHSQRRQEDVRRLLRQVNQKYPRRLERGVRPGFREQRMQAVVQQLKS